MADQGEELFTSKNGPRLTAVKALQSGQGNIPGLNGCLKLEPCVSGFDKLQSEPLKACMIAISSLTQKQLLETSHNPAGRERRKCSVDSYGLHLRRCKDLPQQGSETPDTS